jgi:hypothetical protein
LVRDLKKCLRLSRRTLKMTGRVQGDKKILISNQNFITYKYHRHLNLFSSTVEDGKSFKRRRRNKKKKKKKKKGKERDSKRVNLL